MTIAYDALIQRRSASAKHLVAPGPETSVLHRILFAASRAPDHGRLHPFRFVIIRPESRVRFADVLAEAARQDRPDLPETEIGRAREKAHQGPCLIGLIARIDTAHPKIPASDQWLTVGCALENLLLATAAEGFAAAVRSGRSLEAPAIREAFALGPNEHFTCFIALGTPSEWPPAKPKPDVAELTSQW
ncbi:MAG TPA: nitroreductase [Beijerinckiaceae bacterium]|nr:nitroreductase [Beijerinckiaceae bacterium]